jgi:hypothetical protein
VLNDCECNCFEGSISSSSSVPVKALCVSTPEAASQDVSSDESKTSSPPPVCGGLEERCKMALQHVALGLQCLQYFDGSDKDDCKQQDGVHKKCQFQVLHCITLHSLDPELVKITVGCEICYINTTYIQYIYN